MASRSTTSSRPQASPPSWRVGPTPSADLVIAADVFVYLGDLAPCFHQSARVLKPGGLLAFTVQSHQGEGITVGQDRRFAHAEGWVREALVEAGLKPVVVEQQSTRIDRGEPVPGLLIIAERH
jgi:predicted TPR repeat methyltransferase